MTFTDVSGVTTLRTKYGTFTDFNFTADGRREYAVQIRGDVRVERGLTVTAVLRDLNNWQTLEGWLNHRSGCIEGVSSILSLRFAAILFGALLAAVLVVSFVFRSGGRGEHALGIGMSIVFALAALHPFVNWYRGMQVWEELGALKSKSRVT